jgi:1-aminocyclopropane-1-carboxylate deaminase/D-cysteine desulfhydrase-like pyridoxal-dependent ACC family enzyme
VEEHLTAAAEAIQRAIDQLPRHCLLHLPTPLHACPRLSAHLGGPRLWIKRDDLTGLAFGGNKSRYLEFTLAEATRQGADAVVLSAVVQSNHCRQFAAACARLGLKAVLVLRQDPSPMGQLDPATANFLLDRLCGARVRVAAPDQVQTAIAEEMERLSQEGHKPFTGLSGLLSRIAYVQCALEIERQCAEMGLSPRYLFVGSGGNTLAGLVAGFELLGRPLHLVGTPQGTLSDLQEAPARIALAAQEAAAHLGFSCHPDPERIRVDDGYVGPGFGYVDQATREAVLLLAREEGLLVDPTYTGKALAALLDQVRQGRFSRDEDLLFVHTGGTPLLFAYGRELLPELFAGP